MMKVLQDAGMHVVVLRLQSKYGAVETREEARNARRCFSPSVKASTGSLFHSPILETSGPLPTP
jgi:hypothetical protein